MGKVIANNIRELIARNAFKVLSILLFHGLEKYNNISQVDNTIFAVYPKTFRFPISKEVF
ncbi:hypothetical protein A3E15_02805 [Candidatus Woesebacteria bacterium RIFCSPHIGHO2_12_FULL_42_9]|uniref:Uncharacterized protein n=1 Tax=Candidatus Woesebacteria bacterium RIFCSPHIGHO2_12_FULL_42_9 TaxID=1802511 RepID=A0A1F8AR76_9BACT|nr:MAG: hypothetical protein A3E15_02805 [Candidatus Woesebacteria bacterium RIFCSPHIGHO2_12_FULL_42_9]